MSKLTKGRKVVYKGGLPSYYNDIPQVGAIYTLESNPEWEDYDEDLQWATGLWVIIKETNNGYPLKYFRPATSLRRK